MPYIYYVCLCGVVRKKLYEHDAPGPKGVYISTGLPSTIGHIDWSFPTTITFLEMWVTWAFWSVVNKGDKVSHSKSEPRTHRLPSEIHSQHLFYHIYLKVYPGIIILLPPLKYLGIRASVDILCGDPAQSTKRHSGSSSVVRKLSRPRLIVE